MKNCKLAGLVAVCMQVAGASSAAPISGDFLGANATNTAAQGGGVWTGSNNLLGEWLNYSGTGDFFSSTMKIATIDDSGGHIPTSVDDVSIVTTITGLIPGETYQVNLIWSGVWGHSQANQAMWVGFDPGSVTQLPGKNMVPFGAWVDEPSNNSSTKVWEDPIGAATADASGNLEVYINNVLPSSGVYSALIAYNGLSYSVATTTLIGNYNDDDVVDAADYAVWRNNLGTEFALPNRDPANTGVVSQADYDSWRANYGASNARTAAAVAAAPEPGAVALLVIAAAVGVAATRR